MLELLLNAGGPRTTSTETLIPNMTSDTSNGFTVMGSGRYTTYQMFYAFDNRVNNLNYSWVYKPTGTVSESNPVNIGIRRTDNTPFTITKYRLTNRYNNVSPTQIFAPTSWTLQAYNIGTDSWYDVHSVQNSTVVASAAVHEYTLPAATSSGFRLNITGLDNPTWISLQFFELFGYY